MDERKPIGGGLAFALIATAVLIDLLQALLTFLIIGVVVNPLLNILVGITFSLMLATHGGGIVRKRAISMVLTTLGEFFPVINALPLWTAFALYTVFVDRITHSLSHHEQAPVPRRSRGWRL